MTSTAYAYADPEAPAPELAPVGAVVGHPARPDVGMTPAHAAT